MDNYPLIVAALVLIGAVIVYNKLIRGRQLVREAWSGIDVQLKRRHDLVPELVEVTKGYLDFEREVLTRIAETRSTPSAAQQVADSENALTQQIKSLFAVVEAYPKLKSSRNVLELQKSLVKVEDDIQYARRYYNGTVRDFNTLAQSFPINILAATFGFRPFQFFEIEYATERENPDVSFV